MSERRTDSFRYAVKTVVRSYQPVIGFKVSVEVFVPVCGPVDVKSRRNDEPYADAVFLQIPFPPLFPDIVSVLPGEGGLRKSEPEFELYRGRVMYFAFQMYHVLFL